ncbi:MAG: undecaprenyldiphospho-muramoylpentapeptide beta-N-acetylglucosaminyltransferase [Nocardioides sp.]
MTRVLLAGGGTAGHTSPLLATADAIRLIEPDAEITCLGTARGLETTVVPAAGYRLELVPPVPLPRSITLDLAKVPWRLTQAVREAAAVIRRVRADVVVGYGGYVSLPAYLAAKRLGLPLVLHEQNALPGLANRVGARLASVVAVSFPDTPLPRARYVGLPIRPMIATLDRAALRAEARAQFGLDADRPTLLVTGGSQGAARINAAVSGAAQALVASGAQVLHVVGPKGSANPGEVDPRHYVVKPFVDRMDWAYAAADLVLCRAGANSVTEAAAVGLPAVFVPLPIGNGEQRLNAAPVVSAGGALLVEDQELTAQRVQADVIPLLLDAQRLHAMGAAASGLVPRDAAAALARLIVDAAGRRS